MIKSIVKILGVSKNSYWNYKNQNRPIISLLEKYFTEDDLEEFLETGAVTKYDNQTPSRIKKLENIINIELLNRIERLEQKIILLEEK